MSFLQKIYRSVLIYIFLTIIKSQKDDYFFLNVNDTSTILDNSNFQFKSSDTDSDIILIQETSDVNINYKNISDEKNDVRVECRLLMTFHPNSEDRLLKLFWSIHIYLFSVLFIIASISSFLNILLLLTISAVANRKYFLYLNLMLLTSSLARSSFLIYDPYNSNNSYPKIFEYFIYKITYPCLSSSLGFIFLIFFQSANLKFPRPIVVLTIISFHFLFILISDIMSGWFGDSFTLFIICQIIFITWLTYLSATYIYNFRELLKIAIIKHGEYLRTAFTRSRMNKSNFRKLNYCFVTKICLVITILCILLACFNIYGIVILVFNYEICNDWNRWCYHSINRCLEIIIFYSCFLLIFKSRCIYYRQSFFEQFACCSKDFIGCRSLRIKNQNQCQPSTSSFQSSELFWGSTIVKNSSAARFKTCSRNFITTINEESEMCEDRGIQDNILFLSKWNDFGYSPDTKSEEQDSILACAGSKTPSLEDSYSPIFRSYYCRKASPCSFATTDNSADTSDQLTPAKHAECKMGSSCSSESAGNSFDVTLFRFWTREPHHVNGYTVSPLQSHPFRLELRKDMVSVACGTEDITPDSAINVDVIVEEKERISTATKCLSECDLNKTVDKYGQRKTLSDGSHRKVFINLKRNETELKNDSLINGKNNVFCVI